MVVEKVIDLVFKALDAIDAARARIDNVIVRKAKRKVSATANVKTPVVRASKATKSRSGLLKKHSLKSVTVTKPLDTNRSAKKIESVRATQIIEFLKSKDPRVVHPNAEVAGKKSLAWVMWAFGVADKTQMAEGISVHDVSALLYHAAKIEVYPINVSRMVHDHTNYIRQASQEKRTKRYLLTDEGQELVAALPLSELQLGS